MTRGLSALLALLLACPARLLAGPTHSVTPRGASLPPAIGGPAAPLTPLDGPVSPVSGLQLPVTPGLEAPGGTAFLGDQAVVAPSAAAEAARTLSSTVMAPVTDLRNGAGLAESKAVVGVHGLPAASPVEVSWTEVVGVPETPAGASVADRLEAGITRTVALNWETRRADSAEPAVTVETKSLRPALAPGAIGEAAPDPALEVPAPRSRLSRALRIGALTGLAMFALDMVALAAAQVAGYKFSPSYQMPVFSDPASFSFFGPLAPAIAKFQELFIGAFLAPFNEEPYFRAGVIGLLGVGALSLLHGVVWLASRLKAGLNERFGLSRWINPVAFAVVAVESAVLFTVLHEMSDPVLIGLRMAQALLFSYLYVKEGIASTLAHHATFNFVGLLLLPLVFAAVGGVPVVLWPQALLFAALIGAAWLLLWRLTRPAARFESAELEAGRLVPYRLSSKASLWLGRFGWLGVLVLLGSAALAPSLEISFLMVAMALQVAPGAMAFGAYGWLLRNLGLRKGPAAVAELRAPKNPYPLGNGAGWLAAMTTFGMIASFIATLLGAVSLGFMSYRPEDLGWGMAWLLPLPAAWIAATAVRLWKRRSGIPPWLYVASATLNSAMLALVLAPILVMNMPWNEIEASLQEIKRLGGR